MKEKKLTKTVCVLMFLLMHAVFGLNVQNTMADNEQILFLHHSTGEGVYWEGGVPEWISAYNQNQETSFQIFERAYPDEPYPWENYPYDYWNLWINGACDSSNPNIECVDTLTQKYNVIIFKHCFPGAAIEEDIGNPDVSTQTKTLENYKEQYRALRDLMDSYPDNLFMVWTLTPLHRLATNSSEAARARQFVEWVKNDFLSEDGKAHNNITIFDFWGIVAEDDTNPPYGKVNCLKYEYEGSHFSSDSHPNQAANETAGPMFAQAIVTAIESFFGTSDNGNGSDNETDSDNDTNDDDGADNTCVATQLLGSIDPRLEVLRKFRDNVLAKSAAGRVLIEQYYKNGAVINNTIIKSPLVEKISIKLLEGIMPAIEHYTEK
jgi:hypothetical protein